MKKVILSLSLWLLILSCPTGIPTEPTNSKYSRVARINSFNSSNQLTSYANLEYDTSGLFVRLDNYDTNTSQSVGELRSYRTLEYNSANRFIRENQFHSSGQLSLYVSYILDDSTGRITRTEYYDSNEQMTQYSLVEYLDNDTKKLVRLYNTDDVSILSNILNRNANFNITRILQCDRSCFVLRDYEYATNRLIRRNEYDSRSNLFRYLTYEYDSANRLIRLNNHRPNSNLSSYETFEYENVLSDSEIISQAQSGFGFRYWYPL